MRQFLNIVGWIGTALVVAAVVLRLSGQATNLLGINGDQYVMYLALAGLVLVLLYPIFNWREVVEHFGRRQARYAAVSTTSIVVMLGILVAVNFLSNRRSTRWDLTENSVNSLSEQSLRVLTELEAPLNLVVIDRGDALEGHRARMGMYDNASNQVSVEFLDGERDPLRAKQYGIEVLPTIIVEYMDRMEKVTTVEEREITSAIIRAVTGSQRKLYFVQGHGERDPKGEDAQGYGFVSRLLQADNVAVEPLVLTQHKDVPEDATMVAVVGPTSDPLDEEVDQLRRYLARGGKLLLMLDPPIGERAQPVAKLTALAKEWGIEVGVDVVLDVSGRSQSPTFAVASPPYPSHPITDRYGVSTVYIVARSVTAASPAPEGKTVQPLVQTSEAAWAETDLAGLQKPGAQPEMNGEDGDKAGPVGMAATATAPVEQPEEEKKDEAAATADDAEPAQTRLAVFGDSDFASNAIANTLGNADLFLNTVNWLSAQENLIAIRPREPRDARLTVTPADINLIRWFSLLILPAAVIGAGVYTWTRRRRA
jgi:ABC-type uncharacterized transport system involved in gliding motility auxiliary subunit